MAKNPFQRLRRDYQPPEGPRAPSSYDSDVVRDVSVIAAAIISANRLSNMCESNVAEAAVEQYRALLHTLDEQALA